MSVDMKKNYLCIRGKEKSVHSIKITIIVLIDVSGA